MNNNKNMRMLTVWPRQKVPGVRIDSPLKYPQSCNVKTKWEEMVLPCTNGFLEGT